jgi:DNA topoisomerase-1
LIPTDIAFLVTDYLENRFKELMNYDFTAKMEELLDKIAE